MISKNSRADRLFRIGLVEIGGVKMPIDSARVLEAVGLDDPESVQADVVALATNQTSYAKLLARCLDGAPEKDAAHWREYVDAVAAAAAAGRLRDQQSFLA